jgi:hypothetical protein
MHSDVRGAAVKTAEQHAALMRCNSASVVPIAG